MRTLLLLLYFAPLHSNGQTIHEISVEVNQLPCVILETQKSLNEVKIFPNPVQDYIEFGFTNEFNKIQIIDFTGKTIQSIDPDKFGKIDVSNLKSGMYIIQFHSKIKNQYTTYKIQKK